MEDLRSYCPAFHIHHISPTPLLMTLAKKDTLCPIAIGLEAYSRALEPKELQILPGGHFDGYINPMFDLTVERQTAFLKRPCVRKCKATRLERRELTELNVTLFHRVFRVSDAVW
jgi:hypothetical protein